MNYIENLLKGQKVEWKTLGEVAEYIRGITYNKTKELQKNEDGWKVLRANNISLSSNSLNFDDVKIIDKNVKVRENQKLTKGDVLICAGSGSKEHIGKVAYISNDLDYTFGGFMGVIRGNKEINSRFLFHILMSDLFRNYLSSVLSSSTINNLNANIVNSCKIPLPPLAVQKEIANILDKFNELEKELEKELELRKKQYEYYRNNLLSFNEIGGGKLLIFNNLQWKTLGEIGEFYGGLTGKNKNDFSEGNAKYISYMNVYSNIAVNLETNDFVKVNDNEKQNAIQYGDVLFTGSSENLQECGITSVVNKQVNEKVYLNSFCFGFRFNNSNLFIPDFLKHLFYSEQMRRQIVKTASGVTRFNVSKKKMQKIQIPLPPIEEQERIAGILDKFDTLTNSITEGLPKEIELRRKQYEYYREKLLSFNKD